MKKTVFLITICNFIAAGIGFFTNAILARYFSFEIYGRINLLLSLNFIVLVFIQFGFQNGLVIFFNKNKTIDNANNTDLSKIFFVNRQYAKFFIYIGIPIAIIFIYIANYFYSFSIIEKIFISCTPLFLGIYTYFSTYYQSLGIWLKYNILNIIYSLLKAIVTLGAFLIIYYIQRENFTYDNYLYPYILYSIILFLIGWYVSRKYIHIGKKNREWSKSFNKILIPIGLSNIIIIFIMRIDNILIEYYLGIKEVAVYAAANSLAFVFPLLTGSIMRVLMKEVSKNSLYFLERILFYQRKYFLHLIIAILVVLWGSYYFIPMIFGSKYIPSISIFQILSIVYIGGIFFTPLESFFYTENPKKIFILKVCQLLLILTLGSILLIFFHLEGMAYTVVISRFFSWGYLYINSKKILKNHINSEK